MATLETAVFAAAKAVGTTAGRMWLAQRAAKEDRNRDLTDLIRITFRDTISRRKVENRIDGISLAVMEQLQPLCEQEFRSLTDADKASVLAEVADTLAHADLSDSILFGSDLNPATITRQIQSQLGHGNLSFQLGDSEARLFEILLELCCENVVRIAIELPQFGPRAMVETLDRLSGITDQVSTLLARTHPRSLDAPDGTDDDEEFSQRYGDHIIRVLDHVELFGVRIRRYRPQTPLSVAYISLNVSTGGNRTELDSHKQIGHLPLGEDVWKEHVHGSAATMRVERALGHRKRTLLRGDAGSGKSTLLRWVAITAVRSGFDSDLERWNGCTPFLVKLRSHADGNLPRPENFLDGTADAIAGLMPKGWVHRRLESGNALLLVDGVDELSPAQRRKVPGWLRGILSSYPEMRVVVTSRPAAASARWLNAESFAVAHLQPMNQLDLVALIRHWHQSVAGSPTLPCTTEELHGYEGALRARLEGAPHLRALAATPLLAAMLCALNLDHATRLPRDRMGLYAATLEMLLDRRDGERDIPAFRDVTMDFTQKTQILRGLAWRLSLSNRAELPKQVVQREIEERLATMSRPVGDPEVVTEYLLQRSGVLRQPVEGRVDFVHRTVQEFLAAQQAVFDHEIEYLVERSHQPTWRETVVMAVGHANGPQSAEIIGGILERARNEPTRSRYLKLLIAACLETATAVPVQLRKQVDDCVDDLLPPRDKATARSLATAGEVVLDRLPRSLEGLSSSQAAATIHSVALINGEKSTELLAGYCKDDRTMVQRELQSVWTYFGSDAYAREVLADAPLIDGCVRLDDDRDASHLRSIKHLRHLHEIEAYCGLTDLSSLSELRPLSGITLFRVETHDLSPILHHAESLEKVYLNLRRKVDPGIFVELKRLSNLNVGFVDLLDLDFVRGLPMLEMLVLRNLRKIRDYSPLLTQKDLKNLWLIDCENLADVDLLPNMEKLTNLSVAGSNLDSGLPELVSRAPNVNFLNLSNCAWVDDISPLASLRIKMLALGGQRLDLGPLSGQSEMRQLSISKSTVDDLSPLAEVSSLRILSLDGCVNRVDLEPLASMTRLEFIELHGASPGIDIGPLADRSDLTIRIYEGQDLRNREGFRGKILETR